MQFASCGDDVIISPNVVIKYPELVRIGNHVGIDVGFYCSIGLGIGDYVHIAPHVVVSGTMDCLLKIGNFANIASGCQLLCSCPCCRGAGLIGLEPAIPERFRDEKVIGSITIGNFAGLGANSVVFPGITLGEGSIVGACSLVMEDTEPWSIYAGVPAIRINGRQRDKMLAFAAELGYVSKRRGFW